MNKSKIIGNNDREKFKKDFNKRLIVFSLNILQFAEELRKDRILWSLTDQLIRSATSIGANVIEAKASSSRKDYIKFFQIALKSANETIYWLILVREYKNNQKADKLKIEVEEISKILASSLITLKKKK